MRSFSFLVLGLTLTFPVFVAAAFLCDLGNRPCVENGKTHPHLAIYSYESQDECRLFQCQDGTRIPVWRACLRSTRTDNQCHAVGRRWWYRGNTYKCHIIRKDGKFYLQNTYVEPFRKGCRFRGKVYRHMDHYSSGKCLRLQCLDGRMRVLHEGCSMSDGCWSLWVAFWKGTQGRQCKKVGTFQYAIQNIVAYQNRGQCKVAGRIVQNFGKIFYSGQCSMRQCVNGRMRFKKEGCNVEGGCRQKGALWLHNGQIYGCRRVVRNGRYVFETYVHQAHKSCRIDGKVYHHFEFQHSSDGCRKRQCVNGKAVFLKAACHFKKDNQCHYVNSVWKYNGVYHKCFMWRVGHTTYFQVRSCAGDEPVVPCNDDDENPTCESEGYQFCEQECTDTATGYKCSCRPGFTVHPQIPTACSAIDECKAVGGSPCQQGCENTEVGYLCFCYHGYVTSPTDFHKCDDINECTQTWNRPCQHICTNTQGGYKCSCHPGFIVSPKDPSKCQAIQTCTTSTCEHICAVTSSGTQCSCYAGYQVSSRDPHLCEDINECVVGKPCAQICTNTVGGYVCSCNEGWIVDASDSSKCRAKEICHSMADIIFVLDGSGSIGVDHWQKQLDFVVKVTNNFQIGTNDVRVGAVVFGDDASKSFNLKDFFDRNSLNQAISRIHYLASQATYTNKALDLILSQDMFGSASGGRDGIPNIVVVLTDGASSRPTLTTQSADNLKASGATIISVGIGKAISVDELRRIASRQTYVFTTETYDAIGVLEGSLVSTTCNVLESTRIEGEGDVDLPDQQEAPDVDVSDNDVDYVEEPEGDYE